jgi:hypothetical protein
MEILMFAALFFVAAEVGAILVWDDAVFGWVLLFYPTAFGLALFGFGGNFLPVMAIWKVVVGLAGFLTGSFLSAWWTGKMS